MRLLGCMPDPLLVHCRNDLCLLEEADSFSGEDLDAREIMDKALDQSKEVAVAPSSRVSLQGSSGETVLTELWLGLWLSRIEVVDLERWNSRRARR